ncbi:MAG: type IV conjugative transfer system lipoprotein TraV [Geminicoccaceae bacterium]
MRAFVSLPLLALGLAGCGAVPGSSSYGCGGLPEGVSCMSARDVYKLTDGGKPVVALPGQPTALDAAPPSPAPAGAAATGSPPPSAATHSPRPPLPATGQVQAIALRPEDAGAADIVPLRTPSRVLRVWIAPWEDTSGRLHVPGYTYAEIEPRRWSIGEGTARGGLQLKPLTPPPSLAPPATPPALQAREPELQDAAAGPPRRRQPTPSPPPRRQADSATQPAGYDQTWLAPP